MQDRHRPVRIVIAEDHPVFREGLLSILQASEVTVLAAVGDAESALRAVRSEPPDVVLMDLALPGMSGLAAIRRLAADNPEVAVLVLTMNEDEASVFAALRAGARGYLIKDASGQDIMRAIQAVASGDAILGGRAAQQVLGGIATGVTPGPPPLPQLTVRERAVLDLVARGYDNMRVARELFISDKTVRNTLTTILAKLPAASRAEAVARARDAGLGVPE